MSNLAAKIPVYILFSTITILASKSIREEKGKEKNQKQKGKFDFFWF
ncbi:MAG: hypothetical protein ACTSWY_05565 [Promethearchaeota archaeon]